MRDDPVWARFVSGEPLSADERRHVAGLLADPARRPAALDDAAIAGALAGLGRAARTGAAFAANTRAVVAHETTSTTFVRGVEARLRRTSRVRRWQAATIGGAVVVAALAYATFRTRPPEPPPDGASPGLVAAHRPRPWRMPPGGPAAALPQVGRQPSLFAALAAAPSDLVVQLLGWAPDKDGMYLYNQAGFECSAYQRFALDTMMVGAVYARAAWVEQGWRVVDATFAHQTTAGNFGDSANCVATWLAWLGAALSVVEEGPLAATYADRVRALAPGLRRAASWLAAPAQLAALRQNDLHYPMPSIAGAAALASMGARFDEPSWRDAAMALAEHGLAAQRADGAFEHLGGHDTGFHNLRTLFLEALLATPGGERFEAAAERAVSWLVSRVDASGGFDLTGNTFTLPEAQGGYLHRREARWVLVLHAARSDPALYSVARRLRR